MEAIPLASFPEEPVERVQVRLARCQADCDPFAPSGANILPPGSHHSGEEFIFSSLKIGHPGAAQVDRMRSRSETQLSQCLRPFDVILHDIGLDAYEEATAPARLHPG